VVEGDSTILFDVPSWAASGETYGRFRLSTGGNLTQVGVAVDGEVEDHLVDLIRGTEIHGIKYEDITGNNELDPGDVPLAGVTFELLEIV
jgi:hypothetical protein